MYGADSSDTQLAYAIRQAGPACDGAVIAGKLWQGAWQGL